LGARNHQAFYEANKDNPSARCIFLENGKTPKQIPSIPKEALKIDRHELAQFALDYVRHTDVPAHIRRGAMLGERIWGKRD
jgi:hypothetical protein